jgi:hypothetical protein
MPSGAHDPWRFRSSLRHAGHAEPLTSTITRFTFRGCDCLQYLPPDISAHQVAAGVQAMLAGSAFRSHQAAMTILAIFASCGSSRVVTSEGTIEPAANPSTHPTAA